MAAPQRIPGIAYAAAPAAEAHASALAWPPRLVVVHDTGNPTSSRAGEASYAHTRAVNSATTSAHAYIDAGGVLGSLRLDRQAWSAKSYGNRVGLHIELCLPGDRTATRRHAAALVRQLCAMAGIPMVKLTPAQVKAGARGVCGHRDFTLAGIDNNDHNDPGADFPWAQFMTWVNDSGHSAATEESNDMADFTPDDSNAWHQAERIDAAVNMREHTATTGEAVPLVTTIKSIEAQQRALTDYVQNTLPGVIAAQMPGGGGVSVAELRDAVADLGEGGAAQVRADA